MSKRSIIFLAVGMLALGLILGFIGGGVGARWMLGRATARNFAINKSAPGMMYGAPGAMPFNPRGMMAPQGGMPFGGGGFNRGMMAPRGGNAFGGRGFHRGMPFHGRGAQRRAMPFNGRGIRPGANQFNVTGARIGNVEANSPADKGGLKSGDVITAVAGTNIDASHSFQNLLQTKKPGDKVDLTVNRAGQLVTISVTLGTSPQNANAGYLGIRYTPVFSNTQPFR